MRPSRGVCIFLIAVVLFGAAIFLWFKPPPPRRFNAAQWSASDRYNRFAMSADLATRIATEHWTQAQVIQATGSREASGIGVGWRHPLSGGYYLHVHYDEAGRAKSADIYPE
jgi:hypothetical protein